MPDVAAYDIESTDSEIEMVASTCEQEQLTSKQLRMKLLDFLTFCCPPEPLHWVSFHDHVVRRFKSYYPENIIRDVFQLIDSIISKKRYVSAVIDLDSDCEESSVSQPLSEAVDSNDGGNQDERSSSQAVPQRMSDSIRSLGDSCTETPEEEVVVLTKEDLEVLKKNPAVKIHSKLFKEIYSLLKEIKDSTSCRVCSKLKFRMVKFHDTISKVAKQISKASQAEQETEGTANTSSIESKRRKISSLDSKKSYFQMMGSKFLTEEEADKIREAILMDKLEELSHADVITENIPAKSNTPLGSERKIRRRRKSTKSTDSNEAQDEPVQPDDGVPTNIGNGNKKKRKRSKSTPNPSDNDAEWLPQTLVKKKKSTLTKSLPIH